MLPARQLLAYATVTVFVLFFISDGISDKVYNFRSLTKKGRKSGIPDFSFYEESKTLSANQFPLDNSDRRTILVGDIHGMHKFLSVLLDKLSFDPTSDVLVHVGDIVTKGPHDGSMAVLSYMALNNITGVRGNHDQKVIEWRGWINWIRSLPGGERWLEDIYDEWTKAKIEDASLAVWMTSRKKKDETDWWRKIPDGWTLFSDHFKIAHALSEAQYDYLLSLPLKLYVPSAHAYVVHAGLLPSDPRYPHNDHRQPLAHIPSFPSVMNQSRLLPKSDTLSALRVLQDLAVMNNVSQNKKPWNVLNMRSIMNKKVMKTTDGKSWSRAWNHDISRCEGFNHDVPVLKHKFDLLPCYPSTVIYGHAASRGLDIKRWSIGLDSGCVYQRRLSSLVLGPKSNFTSRRRNADLTKRKSAIPFGDSSQGRIVSVPCF